MRHYTVKGLYSKEAGELEDCKVRRSYSANGICNPWRTKCYDRKLTCNIPQVVSTSRTPDNLSRDKKNLFPDGIYRPRDQAYTSVLFRYEISTQYS